jgi:Fe-S oxidoreductase
MTLLREVLDGKLKLTEGVKTRFVLCTNCGRCQAVCLKLINLSDAFATINMYIKDGVLEDRVSEYLKGKRKNGKTI